MYTIASISDQLLGWSDEQINRQIRRDKMSVKKFP